MTEFRRVPLSTGVTLNVALDGAADAPPVLLLHGFPESHRTWRELAPRLRDRFRLVMPDQRGFAGSDRPQDVEAYKPAVRSRGGARLMLCGGAPMDGERHVWWNFVSSSRDRINEAKRAWKAGEFALPPDDHDEFIPLPEIPTTVSYP